MKFRSAHGSHPDGTVAVEECVLGLAAYAGDTHYARNPNLGFVYLTDALAPQAEQILTLLKLRTGVANWVGTAGIGIAAGATEFMDEPALAVMLGEFRAGSVNVFSGTQRPPAAGTRTDRGSAAAHTALVHADPETPELPELIADMARKVDSGYLFGGVVSSRSRPVQIADRVLTGGLSGAVFGADVDVVSRVTQGVHPLARAARRRVTEAQDNLILELDGRPALEALLEDAGIRSKAEALAGDEPSREDAARHRAQLQALGRRGLFVGIAPEADGYREARPALRDDYLVRHVVAIDPGRGAVAIAAMVEPGMGITFCTRDDNAARRDLVRICAEIRDHLHEQSEARGEDVTPRGAVYVSCLGRGSHMFGESHEELRVIRQQLGDVPLVGFYAGGEIGGKNLYGFTGVLTVFC
ncbi:MAG: FIST C-terminal domain-containing protein [Betaproteobacteria bacterium]